jgi:hypothetical protein
MAIDGEIKTKEKNIKRGRESETDGWTLMCAAAVNIMVI